MQNVNDGMHRESRRRHKAIDSNQSLHICQKQDNTDDDLHDALQVVAIVPLDSMHRLIEFCNTVTLYLHAPSALPVFSDGED